MSANQIAVTDGDTLHVGSWEMTVQAEDVRDVLARLHQMADCEETSSEQESDSDEEGSDCEDSSGLEEEEWQAQWQAQQYRKQLCRKAAVFACSSSVSSSFWCHSAKSPAALEICTPWPLAEVPMAPRSSPPCVNCT